MRSTEGIERIQFARLREFQERYRVPVTDIARQQPSEALESLRVAAGNAPQGYREYLSEAVDCYEVGAYRGAILMVWSAAIEHLYETVEGHPHGFRIVEEANKARFGSSKTYHRIRKKNDLLYLNDKNFFFVCEDAGMFNRNARTLLQDRLDTRNRCGHPSRYVIGRGETVVFVEGLIKNIIDGAMLDW